MLKRISIPVALALLLVVAAPSPYAQQIPAAEEEKDKGKAPDTNAGGKDNARIKQWLVGKSKPKQEEAEPPLVVEQPERIPVRVVLNSQVLKDQITVLMPDGDMLVPPQLIPFREPPPRVDFEGEPFVSLRSLAPALVFQLEVDTLVLNITADPKLFKTHVLDFARRPPNYALAESGGAYLNYAIGYSMGPGDEFQSMSLPWEVAMRLLGGSAFSSFSTSRSRAGNGTVEESVRGNTNITWDFPEGPSTLVAGDVSASSGPLGGGAQLGGLSFSRNFDLKPYYITHQRLRLSGVADSPSEVTVLINGRFAAIHKVPPGEFDLLNIPGAQGLGDATLIIKDAFGREKRVNIPFFVSTQLLRPGLHEFNYSIGSNRVGLGSDSNEYGAPAFAGFHRYGIFSFFSAALSAEAGTNRTNFLDSGDNLVIEENDVLSGGVSGNISFGDFGQIDLDSAYSRQEQGGGEEPLHGRAASMGYSVSAGFVSFSFSGSSFTPYYATLSQGAEQEGKLGRSWSAGVGLGLGPLGQASARQANRENFDGSQSLSTSLSYALQLGDSISLSASANHNQSLSADGEETERLSLSGSILMSLAGHGVSLSQRTDETGRVSRRASLAKGAPSGSGFGYSFSGDRSTSLNGSQNRSGEARLRYNGPFGIYSATQRRTAQRDSDGVWSEIERSSSLSMAGGFAAIDGNVHHSRPIGDGFALLRVAGLQGVRVSANGQEAGETDEDGEVLVSNLTSYVGNRVSFRGEDVPVDYDFRKSQKAVAVPTRGGTVVNFDIRRIQAFTGHVFFVVDGKKTPAEFAGLFYQVLDAPVESIVGREGEFYLENVPPGTYPALLKKEKMECRFELVIPVSKEVIVELGEVNCEIDKN